MHLRRHLNYANVAATAALIIAVAGIPTAIAVSKGAKRSDINSKGKIRTGHVTTAKLADGSVTAAKIAGVDVVQAAGNGGATVTCPAGERLLGGGGDIPSGGGAALQRSQPEGNGWHAGQNAGTGNSSVTVYALCLKD